MMAEPQDILPVVRYARAEPIVVGRDDSDTTEAMVIIRSGEHGFTIRAAGATQLANAIRTAGRTARRDKARFDSGHFEE